MTVELKEWYDTASKIIIIQSQSLNAILPYTCMHVFLQVLYCMCNNDLACDFLGSSTSCCAIRHRRSHVSHQMAFQS